MINLEQIYTNSLKRFKAALSIAIFIEILTTMLLVLFCFLVWTYVPVMIGTWIGITFCVLLIAFYENRLVTYDEKRYIDEYFKPKKIVDFNHPTLKEEALTK